jgi:hypothetical protein
VKFKNMNKILNKIKPRQFGKQGKIASQVILKEIKRITKKSFKE